MIHFFTSKTFGSLLIGSGAIVGGGLIYWYQMPTTWREQLVKEGFTLLRTEYDYKGMWNDQKDNLDLKKDTSLNEATFDDVQSKAEKYCNGELDKKLPHSFDENTRKRLITFCTSNGIKTVKAKLIQNKKTGWIEGEDAENKWKAVFAVYRYNSEFINWLKEDDRDQNGSLSAETDVAQYSKLKNACEKLLNRDYRGVTDSHIKYGSWWCVELGYKTIREKIQREDPGWAERGQDDSEWDNLRAEWENTDLVKKWANKAKSQDENSDLTVDALKKLCDSNNVDAQLSLNNSYQEKYAVIKSVCRRKN